MRLANYTGRDLNHISVTEDQSIRDAMGVMSKAGLRLIPVVSSQDRCFIGVAADGDLRRFIAAGGALESSIGQATNREPVLISETMSNSDLRNTMQRLGVEHLPLVQDGKLVSLYVIWSTSFEKKLSAVIMAGGLGSRLAPLTDNCPKPLLEVGGKPILTHIIESLRAQGVNDFLLSVNYLSEMIVDHYGDGSELGVNISYIHETERLGTGGALALVDSSTLSDPFLCLNGDILNDIDVEALKDQHQVNNWDATMVVRDYHFTVPYGVVNISDSEAFLNAEEKPTVHYRINAGCYMLSKSILSLVPRREFYDLPTLFEDLVDRGMQGGTYLHRGRWIDVGNVSELERARGIFESVST